MKWINIRISEVRAFCMNFLSADLSATHERRSKFVSAELSAAHGLEMSAELSGAQILKMGVELSAAHILVSALKVWVGLTPHT